MAKKKGRRNNASGSSSFNARAKAQRQKGREEYFYDYDDYSEAEYDHYHGYDPRFDYRNFPYNEYEARYNNHRSRRDNPEPEPEHDHSRGATLCPLCNVQTLLFLGMTELEDKKRLDDLLFSLHWAIYGGLIATLALYYPFMLARHSGAHWLIRWPWIISWHCMIVSLFTGLFLKYYFVKPFARIVYGNKLSRTLPDTLELRSKYMAQLEQFSVRKLCQGVAILFILGVALALAGVTNLVLGRFETVLHGAWSVVKNIILLPLRFTKYVLRGGILRLRDVVHLADRVGRATGRNATKSGALLIAFAKLYGRTLIKLSQSLVAFVVDLAKFLLLTAAAVMIAAGVYLLYIIVSGLIFGTSFSENPNGTHGGRESPKHRPSPRSSGTPPPAYESLKEDLPSGNPGKNKKKRRQPPKHKESVETS